MSRTFKGNATAAWRECVPGVCRDAALPRVLRPVRTLKKHTVAAGVGSRENLIGTGKDDVSDVLDRRVELRPL